MGALRDDLKTTLETRVLSLFLINSAYRVNRRSAELCQSVHERRRRSDFFYRLAKPATIFPQKRRFLPLCGGDGDPLQIEKEEQPEGTIVRVSGEVDLANVDCLKAVLRPLLSNGRNVIVEIGKLRYIDSTGLHFLIDANKILQQHGCQLIVVGATTTVAKIFSFICLEDFVRIVSSAGEARDILRTESPATTANE